MSESEPALLEPLASHDLLGAVKVILGEAWHAGEKERQRIAAEIMPHLGEQVGTLSASELAEMWDGDDLSPGRCAEVLVCMHDGPWRDRLLARVRAAFASDSWESVRAEDVTRLRLTAGPDTAHDWAETVTEESMVLKTLDGMPPTLERDGDPYYSETITTIEVLTKVADLDEWRALAASVGCKLEHIPVGEDITLSDYIGGAGHIRTITRGPSSAPQPRLQWLVNDG